MSGGFLDRQRATRLMAEKGLAALILAQPESLQYAAGTFPGVASLWRRAGAAFIVVPADPEAPLAAVVGDLQAESFARASGIADTRSHPIWVEASLLEAGTEAVGDIAAAIVAADRARGRQPGFARPATFDPTLSLALLRDILSERGLLDGTGAARLGLELGFVPAADLPLFERALPNAVFVDASPLVARLRMIKQPGEIAHLARAARLSVAGMRRLFGELREGLDAKALEELWQAGVEAEAGAGGPVSTWAYISVGADGFAPGGPARAGDVIKVDVGCVVAGYSSDGARTAVLGRASRAQRRIFDALQRAFDAGLAALRPGRPLREAHAAATAAMHGAGFSTYSRGHFGHSLGASIWSEEWPFISADCEVPVEPGMVLAFETPYYVKGLGGFIIEDQFLVTEAGLEEMAAFPRGLIEVAV